jgi:hypothetical protein
VKKDMRRWKCFKRRRERERERGRRRRRRKGGKLMFLESE